MKMGATNFELVIYNSGIEKLDRKVRFPTDFQPEDLTLE